MTIIAISKLSRLLAGTFYENAQYISIILLTP